VKGQSPTIDLFNYYYSLSSSPEAKKSMVWSYTFFNRRIQNPLKDIFQGKSLLVKQLEE
jgi:hypothetical protein